MNKFERKYNDLLQDMRNIADTAMNEDRDFTDGERERLNNMSDEAKRLKDSIQTVSFLDELGSAEDTNQEEIQPTRKAKMPGTVGQQLTGNEEYKAWMNSISRGGRIPDSYKGIRSPSFEIDSFKLHSKDTPDIQMGSEAEVGGAFVTPDDTGIYEPLGRHAPVFRNLISIRQTNSDTVEFVRQLTVLDAAEMVPEANVADYQGELGEVSGQKPLGVVTFERVSETVKTIAVAVGSTKRALSDAAQLRGIIDQELREDLAEKLENQIFEGDGTDENLTGITETSGTLSQAFETDELTTTRKALTTLADLGKQRPTAWAMHPEDWEKFELLQDGENRYYYGGPIGRGTPRLWGVPVMESFHVDPGTAWLANWRKAVIWDRQQDTISFSDSHADWFLRNMVAILAEKRVAFGIIRPSAFVEVPLSS